MARTARASVGGVCCHVLNRGNGRGEVFHKKEVFVAFLDLMEEDERTVALRFVERNALHQYSWRRAEAWPWSSAAAVGDGMRAGMLD